MEISIRQFKQEDADTLHQLFYHTIRHVNCRDYSQAQVEAWAPTDYDKTQWNKRIAEINPFVVEYEGVIVAYADIQPNGYIDHFFCHHQYQGKGIARQLMQHLHQQAKEMKLDKAFAHVSITARPFFEKAGFRVVKAQQVPIRGLILTNYVMEKLV
jgi:putative acetyltransferase